MFISGNKANLFALFFAAILAWASFFSIIFLTNPENAGAFGVAVLYASFTLGLISLTLITWQLRILKKK